MVQIVSRAAQLYQKVQPAFVSPAFVAAGPCIGMYRLGAAIVLSRRLLHR